MSVKSPLRDGNTAGLALIETLRWEPQTGFLRLDRHLARMEASAQALGFEFARSAALSALNGAVQGQVALRIRLTLAKGGPFAVATQDYVAQPPGMPWTLRVARSTLDSRYGLLRHKTTRRNFYEVARAEFPRKAADEVILLNERREVCEGTITNVFIDRGDGVLLTPAFGCGLLPGILRAEMLELGQAHEAVLTRDDLYEARAVYVGNSLRGLVLGRMI